MPLSCADQWTTAPSGRPHVTHPKRETTCPKPSSTRPSARRAASSADGSLNEIKPVNLVVGLIDELRTRFPDLDENLISDLILRRRLPGR